MELTVRPGHPLRGELSLPGDKSISHRAALFAGLAAGRSHIRNFLDAGVTRVMLAALRELGVHSDLHRLAADEPPRLIVQSRGLHALEAPQTVIECGHSGTTIRFLAGALAAADIPTVLDGSAGLRKRPMDRIVDPLRQMGVPIQATGGSYPPLRLEKRPDGQRLRSIDYEIPVPSAQVKTALILAALDADGAISLTEPGLSRDHTEKMMAAMGVMIDVQEDAGAGGRRSITIHPLEAPLAPLDLDIPGDFSSAAFLIVAALITPGSEIKLCNVGVNPTRTGLLEVLQAMGGSITLTNVREIGGEPVADIQVKSGSMRAVEVQGGMVVRMIDEFPIFGVAAAFAQGTSVVADAAELRLKESDRIHVLVSRLRELGVRTEERPDGFVVEGSPLRGGSKVDPAGDHRLAMALAVAGLAARQPVVVSQAEIIEQSFPGFRNALGNLGAGLTTG